MATHDGTLSGDLALWSRETLGEKRRDMGPYTFACQIMQNPKADEAQGFQEAWLKYYDRVNPANMNKYLLVDAANGKRKHNDYTAMWVVGLGPDQNYYVLDIVRDRLNLTQRGKKVMELHRKWKPKQVRYEKYGLMADVQHIETLQENETYNFEIKEVGGQTPKEDRIKRLVPLFEQGRVFLPRTLHYTDYEGVVRELVNEFIEQEYKAFPVPLHDDLLDSLARIEEPEMTLVWPKEVSAQKPRLNGGGAGWMG